VTTLRGFILQASYRVISRTPGPRVPVVHLYGRLESGDTFLVRDDRRRPQFFIRAADSERARALRSPEPRRSPKRNFDGAAVSLLEFDTPPEVPPVRDRLQAAGIETFEADVRFAVRYLIELGIKGGVEIEG
jgi:DNA polymerase II